MSIYSHIVILSTSVLFANDLWPTPGRIVSSPAPFVLQTVPPASRGPSVTSPVPRSSQHQASELSHSKASVSVPPAASAAVSDPPFLKQPIQFGPNSLELTIAGRNMLKRAAAWLLQRHEARILIVGSCDSRGSEPCTRALAEGRGAVVHKFLERSGIASDQIVGVKGWDKLDQSCQGPNSDCQQANRSARIFVAASVAP